MSIILSFATSAVAAQTQSAAAEAPAEKKTTKASKAPAANTAAPAPAESSKQYGGEKERDPEQERRRQEMLARAAVVLEPMREIDGREYIVVAIPLHPAPKASGSGKAYHIAQAVGNARVLGPTGKVGKIFKVEVDGEERATTCGANFWFGANAPKKKNAGEE